MCPGVELISNSTFSQWWLKATHRFPNSFMQFNHHSVHSHCYRETELCILKLAAWLLGLEIDRTPTVLILDTFRIKSLTMTVKTIQISFEAEIIQSHLQGKCTSYDKISGFVTRTRDPPNSHRLNLTTFSADSPLRWQWMNFSQTVVGSFPNIFKIGDLARFTVF